ASGSLGVRGSATIVGWGGTGVVSGTGWGGAAVGGGGTFVVAGGGIGLASGGLLLWHAPANTTRASITTTYRFCVITLGLLRSFRPVRELVVSLVGDLAQIVAVARHRENLHLPGPARRKRDVPSVGRKHRALVRADAVGDLPRLAGREAIDLNIESRSGLRRVGDFVERLPGPRRTIALLVDQRPLAGAVDVHDVDLRRAGPLRDPGDLVAGGRPGGVDVDGGVVGHPPQPAAVAVHDVDLGVAVAVRRERD